MRGGAFFNGKEGRDDFRTPFFKGKEGFCPLQGEPKGSKRLLKVGFRKILLLSKEERGDSITHTFQSPHNIPTV